MTTGSKHPSGSCVRTDRNSIRYLRSLAQIISLRAEHGTNTCLSPFMTLEFLGKRLSWSSFYFDAGTYSDAFSVASEPRAEFRPIIIEGRIKSISEPQEGKTYRTIQFRMKRSESGAFVAPKILVNANSELLGKLKEQDRIAAIGYWEPSARTHNDVQYHNLALLWPMAGQVVKLDDQ